MEEEQKKKKKEQISNDGWIDDGKFLIFIFARLVSFIFGLTNCLFKEI